MSWLDGRVPTESEIKREVLGAVGICVPGEDYFWGLAVEG